MNTDTITVDFSAQLNADKTRMVLAMSEPYGLKLEVPLTRQQLAQLVVVLTHAGSVMRGDDGPSTEEGS